MKIELKRLLSVQNPPEFLTLLKELLHSHPSAKIDLENPINVKDLAVLRSLRVMSFKEADDFYKVRKIGTIDKLIHGLANIELSASIGYFLLLTNYSHARSLPQTFYVEAAAVVQDEIKHFFLLEALLQRKGIRVGDLPSNLNIVTDMAKVDSLEEHIALISLTHEGKGLDAGPRLLQKVQSDQECRSVLDTILADEERHVGFGLKWFDRLMRRKNKREFYANFLKKAGIQIRAPNVAIREKLGFDFYL